MATNKNQKRYGLFYRSHNKWSGPYMGVTFTEYTMKRNPAKSEINYLKNHVLKTRVKLSRVK